MNFLKKIWNKPLTWGTIILSATVSAGVLYYVFNGGLKIFKKKDDDQTKETE